MTGWLKKLLSSRRSRTEAVFNEIFAKNTWMDPDSKSGEGSNLEQTRVIRVELPSLLRRHQVRSMLDAPCGDFFWMRHVDLPVNEYVGADIVNELVQRNQQEFGNAQRRFVKRDLIRDPLPTAELIFCRDCLVHLSFRDIRAALANFRRSAATWLLTTTFPGRTSNTDIPTGEWRPLNLQLAPFSFPAPVEMLNEECPQENGAWADKSLGLWRLDQVT